VAAPRRAAVAGVPVNGAFADRRAAPRRAAVAGVPVSGAFADRRAEPRSRAFRSTAHSPTAAPRVFGYA
jgi:hypothetical protein